MELETTSTLQINMELAIETESETETETFRKIREKCINDMDYFFKGTYTRQKHHLKYVYIGATTKSWDEQLKIHRDGLYFHNNIKLNNCGRCSMELIYEFPQIDNNTLLSDTDFLAKYKKEVYKPCAIHFIRFFFSVEKEKEKILNNVFENTLNGNIQFAIGDKLEFYLFYVWNKL